MTDERGKSISGSASVGSAPRKPPCKLVGTDGNVYSIIGKVRRRSSRTASLTVAGSSWSGHSRQSPTTRSWRCVWSTWRCTEGGRAAIGAVEAFGLVRDALQVGGEGEDPGHLSGGSTMAAKMEKSNSG